MKNKKKYYCTACGRHHVRGKIYDAHLQYRKEADWKPNFRLEQWERRDLAGTLVSKPFSPAESTRYGFEIAEARGKKLGWWARRKLAKRIARLDV